MSSRGDVALVAALLGSLLLAAVLLRNGPLLDSQDPSAPRLPDHARSADFAPRSEAVPLSPSSARVASPARPEESGPGAHGGFADPAPDPAPLEGVDRVIVAAHRRAPFADRLRGVMALDEADRERGLRALAEAISDEGGSADRECLLLLEAGGDPALLKAMAQFFDVAGGKGGFDRTLVVRAIEFMKQGATPAERRAAALLALQYRAVGVLTSNDAALAEVIQRDGDPLLLRKIAWHYRQVTDAQPPPALARVVAHLAEGDARPDTRAAALAARFWVGAGPDRGLVRLQECLAIGDPQARQQMVKAIAESELPSLGRSSHRFDPEEAEEGESQVREYRGRELQERTNPRAPAGLSDMVVRLYQEGADARVRSLFLRSMVSNMGAGGGRQADQTGFLERLAAVERDEAWRGRLQSALAAARLQRLDQKGLMEALYGERE